MFGNLRPFLDALILARVSGERLGPFRPFSAALILARVSGESLRPFCRALTVALILARVSGVLASFPTHVNSLLRDCYFEILSHQFMVAQPFCATAYSGRC